MERSSNFLDVLTRVIHEENVQIVQIVALYGKNIDVVVDNVSAFDTNT